MIHNDIQNQLQLLVKTSAPPLIEVADHALESPQWTPGQQIPAHVLASLPNGRFQVQVEGQILDLNLPRNTQPGETLELTYVTNTPRLTFALLQEPPAAATPSNSGVVLSDTAKLVGDLLRGQQGQQVQAGRPGPADLPGQTSRTGQAGQPGQDVGAVAPQATRTPPVLRAAPTDIPVFAQALKTSVSQSGLFYESHQVQWLSGERSLAALRQEPQGQLPPLVQPARPVSTGPAVAIESDLLAALAKIAARPPTGSAQPVNGIQSSPVAQHAIPQETQSMGAHPELAVSVPVKGGEAKPAEQVHTQALPLVQQQLQALDTRQVSWQGEVWPGQPMYWEIEEQLARDRTQQTPETMAWHTRLNLQLPSLGGVNAKLVFADGKVQLDLAADNVASVELMRRQQQVLTERFAGAGLQLAGVVIRHG